MYNKILFDYIKLRKLNVKYQFWFIPITISTHQVHQESCMTLICPSHEIRIVLCNRSVNKVISEGATVSVSVQHRAISAELLPLVIILLLSMFHFYYTLVCNLMDISHSNLIYVKLYYSFDGV